MTKRQALRSLRSQLQKLEANNSHADIYWLQQTWDYYALIFGEDSFQYQQIRKFAPSAVHAQDRTMHIGKEGVKPNAQLKLAMNNAIGSIRNGAFLQNKNFLSRISEGWLIAIFTGSISVVFAAGTFYGKYLSDTQNTELKQEIEALTHPSDSFNLERQP